MSFEWTEFGRGRCCPICGKGGWCSYSTDGRCVICRRRGSEGGIHRVDRSGQSYWLYFNNHGDGAEPPSPSSSEDRTKQCAEPDVLDSVYSVLLDLFPLTKNHRQNLLQRGLSEEEIEKRKYGSLRNGKRWDQARSLVNTFGTEVCSTVPGFIVKEGKSGNYWTLTGSPGILVPVRDLHGRIIALKIRLDTPNDSGRYRYLSSTGYNGPSPGTQVHVPLFNGPVRDLIRVTEGELKADIATVLSGILTLSIPGVAAWRTALPILKRLKIQTVRLAFDMDAETNPVVSRCLKQFASALVKEQYSIELERWR